MFEFKKKSDKSKEKDDNEVSKKENETKKKNLTLKESKNKIPYINAVDEIEPDFVISKEFTDKKNENENFYIPKEEQNKIIVIKYDRGSDSSIMKQAIIIARDNLYTKQFQTIAPQIKKELNSNNYDVIIKKNSSRRKATF